MSTRCEVRVVQAGSLKELVGSDEGVYLYHHSDGYPDHIVPDIKEAWRHFSPSLKGNGRLDAGIPPGRYGTYDWQLGRDGYVAGMLCAVCPGFQPQSKEWQGNHSDLAYAYTLFVGTPDGDEEHVQWELLIESPNFGGETVHKRAKLSAYKGKKFEEE